MDLKFCEIRAHAPDFDFLGSPKKWKSLEPLIVSSRGPLESKPPQFYFKVRQADADTFRGKLWTFMSELWSQDKFSLSVECHPSPDASPRPGEGQNKSKSNSKSKNLSAAQKEGTPCLAICKTTNRRCHNSAVSPRYRCAIHAFVVRTAPLGPKLSDADISGEDLGSKRLKHKLTEDLRSIASGGLWLAHKVPKSQLPLSPEMRLSVNTGEEWNRSSRDALGTRIQMLQNYEASFTTRQEFKDAKFDVAILHLPPPQALSLLGGDIVYHKYTTAESSAKVTKKVRPLSLIFSLVTSKKLHLVVTKWNKPTAGEGLVYQTGEEMPVQEYVPYADVLRA